MNKTMTGIHKLKGTISVPGDKSISHRAVMFGAIAEGETLITNFLPGADCLSTMACFKSMGVEIEALDPQTVRVKGKGLHGLKEPEDILDVGNSGTTFRLISGILAGQPFTSTLTGDASIRKRPMKRVNEPLQKMGAVIIGRKEGNFAPISIKGASLRPIDYTSSVASAQVKSAIILAGLYADGPTSVTEPHLSRDHTERMLRYLGADITTEGTRVTVKGNPVLSGKPIEVPGDISSAAFLMAAAAILPGSKLRINRVGVNPTRTGMLDVLKNMGADIQLVNQATVNGEPIADIIITGGKDLQPANIGGDMIPRLIDEIPVIAVMAAFAKGETVIRNAAELKVKESNRIATVTAELQKLGVDITETEDGMIIKGGAPLKGAVCSSYHDHRIAMAVAVAALAAEGETVIHDAECVDVSFPGFYELLDSVSESKGFRLNL